MTSTAALFSFWSSFGIPAFPALSVPEKQGFPYLTYEISDAQFGDPSVNIAVQVWYRTESEKTPNDKVREIDQRIGRGGVMLPCDGGGIWITKGSPFCLHIGDPTDRLIKLRQLNVNLEYIL